MPQPYAGVPTCHPYVIHSVNAHGNTGLHIAALHGRLDIFKFLIEELHLDPLLRGQYGRNSFVLACSWGKTDIIKYLSERFPSIVARGINGFDKHGKNGLDLAAQNGHLETFVFLIDELHIDPGFLRNRQNPDGFSLACGNGKVHIVNFYARRFPRRFKVIIKRIPRRNNNQQCSLKKIRRNRICCDLSKHLN